MKRTRLLLAGLVGAVLMTLVGVSQAAATPNGPIRNSMSATSVPNWYQQSPAVSPPAGGSGAMAYDAATGQMLLFLGTSDEPGVPSQTWTWNGATWIQLSPATSPPSRVEAVIAYDPATQNVVLYGGVNDNGWLDETWTWDGSTWTQQHPSDSPNAEDAPSMAYDASTRTLLLFGGSEPGSLQDNTWTWDGSNWTQQFPANSPPARFYASMDYDQATGNVVLFGGYDNSPPSNFGDTWTWDGSNWTQQFPANSPHARGEATMNFDPATGNMVLFGGDGSAEYGDTWTWDGSNWTQQMPATSPHARNLAIMGYDPATKDMVLFGGSYPVGPGGADLNDTWIWGPVDPTVTTASVSPTSSTDGSSVTYSATVESSGSGVPTGMISFSVGSMNLCTATLTGDSGSCSASNAPFGMDTVTATYTGDATFAPSAGTTPLTVTSGAPSVTCSKVSGNVATYMTLKKCAPLVKVNKSASASASFLVSGGTLTWAPSSQTTTASSTASSPGQGACKKNHKEQDITGVVTGGTSSYTRTYDPVALRICESSRGAIALVSGTTASL